MSGTTPHLGLYLPGGGSTGTWTPDEVADIDPINQDLVDIDTWALGTDGRLDVLEGYNQQFTGPAASIGAVVGMKRGDTYQETDDDFQLWSYDGASWITAQTGMFKILPTLVPATGASIAGGNVILAGVTGTITLTGIFPARFDRFLIDVEIDNAVGDSGALFALRTSGGPISTGYFGTFTEQAVGIAAAKNDTNNSSTAPLGRYATNGAMMQLELIRPSKAVGGNKQFMTRSADGASYQRIGGGYVNTGAVLDGIDLVFPVAVTNGRIKIYGLV